MKTIWQFTKFILPTKKKNSRFVLSQDGKKTNTVHFAIQGKNESTGDSAKMLFSIIIHVEDKSATHFISSIRINCFACPCFPLIQMQLR